MSEIRWESNGRGIRRTAEGIDGEYRNPEAPLLVGYRLRYVDSKGQRRTKTLRGVSLQEAKAARNELLGRKARNEIVLPTKILFKEAAERWYREGAAGGWSKATRRAYRIHLNHLEEEFGHLQMQKITTDDVADYLTVMREANLSKATISARLMIFGGVYRKAHRKHAGLQDPSQRLERKERASKRRQRKVTGDDVLTRKEIDELLTAATPTMSFIFECMLLLGTRISELLSLRWRDVDFEKGVVYIRAHADSDYDTKTAAGARTLRLPSGLALKLKKHRLESRYSQDHHTIFATERSNGGPRDPDYVNLTLKRLVQKLGWKKEIEVTTHILRHTCAAIMISEHRADITYIQYMLGHDDLSTTQDTYLHLFHPEERVDEMADKWNSWFYGEEVV